MSSWHKYTSPCLPFPIFIPREYWLSFRRRLLAVWRQVVVRIGSNGSKGFASDELDIDYLRTRPHVCKHHASWGDNLGDLDVGRMEAWRRRVIYSLII